MGIKRIEETDRFECVDEDGNSYPIIEFTEFVEAGTWGGRGGELEGNKFFELEDGAPVNRINAGEFRIVGSGKVLTME
jgi:hypothetical protein